MKGKQKFKKGKFWMNLLHSSARRLIKIYYWVSFLTFLFFSELKTEAEPWKKKWPQALFHYVFLVRWMLIFLRLFLSYNSNRIFEKRKARCSIRLEKTLCLSRASKWKPRLSLSIVKILLFSKDEKLYPFSIFILRKNTH